MTTSKAARASGVVPVRIDEAWDVAQPVSPVGLYPRFGPLPAVVAVRHQSGDWRSPGQTRTLMLSDGGSVVEHTEIVDAPRFFAYRLTDFQKLFGVLVESARAEWTYTEVAAGTLIEWTYAFFPRRGAGAVVGAIVRVFWAPYMRRVLPSILDHVESEVGSRRS